MFVMIGIDCIGSCKAKYHTTMTATCEKVSLIYLLTETIYFSMPLYCLSFDLRLLVIDYPFGIFKLFLSFSLKTTPIISKHKHTCINRVMVVEFNATFNNLSAISWRLVLLVEETGENLDMPYVINKLYHKNG